MSFVVQGEITVDAKGVVQGVSVSKAQLESLGKVGKSAGDKIAAIGPKTASVGKSSGLAAGGVANLTAQFNDIGVMLAAGQNPLQLAIQQGTQITQVIGPMGAAGAVKALGSAFVQMINPVSLVTLGVIAGGAALVQWAIGAGRADNAGESFADTLNRIESELSEYYQMIETQNDGGAAVFDEARESIEQTSQAYQDLIAIAKLEAFNSIGDLNSSIVHTSRDSGLLRGELTQIAELITGLDNGGSLWLIDPVQAQAFNDLLSNLDNAAGLENQHAAAIALRDAFTQTVDVSGEMTASQVEFWKNLNQSIYQMELLGAAAETAGAVDFSQSAEVLNDQLVVGGQELLRNERITRLMQGGMKAATIQAVQLAGVDLASPVLDAVDQSALLEAGLEESVIQALELAGMDLTSPITSAANEASRLAQNLAFARGARIDAIVGGNVDYFDPRNEAGLTDVIPEDRPVPIQNRPGYVAPSVRRRSGGGGGGGGGARSSARSAAAREAEREREAVEDLLASLQGELDLSRETDPVLQEMIGYRNDLVAATDEERTAVEALIRTRLEEEALLERQQAGWDFWGNAALTALNDVDGALDMVLKSLQQAALLGTGPLGALFGGTNENGSGGLLGMIMGGITGRAEGGPIYGAGGPRDDRQLIKASPGEYIINAQATSRHRALLDQINYGTPAFANGGILGGQSTAGGFGVGSSGKLEVNVHVHGAVGDKDLEARANAGTMKALQSFNDDLLPHRVLEISANPERIG